LLLHYEPLQFLMFPLQLLLDLALCCRHHNGLVDMLWQEADKAMIGVLKKNTQYLKYVCYLSVHINNLGIDYS
jgi:hypothetical protein